MTPNHLALFSVERLQLCFDLVPEFCIRQLLFRVEAEIMIPTVRKIPFIDLGDEPECGGHGHARQMTRPRASQVPYTIGSP